MGSIGIVIGIIVGLIVLIWISAEFKRAKHKILAILLVAVILFVYFSASTIFKEKNVDLKNVNGIADAFKVYFSWLGGAFSNVKSFTSNVINGQGNKSS